MKSHPVFGWFFLSFLYIFCCATRNGRQGVLRECLLEHDVERVMGVGRGDRAARRPSFLKQAQGLYEFFRLESEMNRLAPIVRLAFPRSAWIESATGIDYDVTMARRNAGAAQPEYGVHLRHRRSTIRRAGPGEWRARQRQGPRTICSTCRPGGPTCSSAGITACTGVRSKTSG